MWGTPVVYIMSDYHKEAICCNIFMHNNKKIINATI